MSTAAKHCLGYFKATQSVCCHQKQRKHQLFTFLFYIAGQSNMKIIYAPIAKLGWSNHEAFPHTSNYLGYGPICRAGLGHSCQLLPGMDGVIFTSLHPVLPQEQRCFAADLRLISCSDLEL